MTRSALQLRDRLGLKESHRRGFSAIAAILAGFLLPSIAQTQPIVSEPVRVALPQNETLRDQAVASITIAGDDGPPVFVYESELRVGVRALLASSGAPDPLTIEVHESVTGSVLNDLIGEKLLERESLRSDDPALAEVEVRRAVQLLAQRMGPITLAQLAAACGTTTDTIVEGLYRKSRVAQYLRLHQERLLEPAESEIRSAFERGRFGPYPEGSTDYRSVRVLIRDRLSAEAMPRAVRSVLRAMGPNVRIRRWPLVL